MSRKAMQAKKPVEKEPVTSIRLDKFLKISRIIKRRSVANDACSTGHVTVNGKEGKPGTDVRVGDILGIRFGDKYSEYEILSIAEHAAKQDAASMYRQSPVFRQRSFLCSMPADTIGRSANHPADFCA